MSVEKIIKGKMDSCRHAGRISTMRRLDSAMAQLKDWRNQRTEAHLTGHSEPELCYPSEIGGHFQIEPDPYTDCLVTTIFEAKKKPS